MSPADDGGDYSEVADAQLDELEAGGDVELYNDILTVCQFIFDHPGQAQSMSSAVTTTEGITMRLAVPGHPPFKVFWSTDGPRIEAVFPHP